ncbi:MAG: hypothetical protein PHP50_08300 [Lachnospiraceae bacterium]|nr:hypothetical protein [Lachnospiraceae bacterium]
MKKMTMALLLTALSTSLLIGCGTAEETKSENTQTETTVTESTAETVSDTEVESTESMETETMNTESADEAPEGKIALMDYEITIKSYSAEDERYTGTWDGYTGGDVEFYAPENWDGGELKEGTAVRLSASQAMTMSIPPQIIGSESMEIISEKDTKYVK